MAYVELFNTSLFNDPALRFYGRLENVNDAGPNGYNLTNNNSVTFAAAKVNNGAIFGTANSNKSLTYATGNIFTTTTPANQTFVGWVRITGAPSGTTYVLFGAQTTSGTGGAQTNCYYVDTAGTKTLNATVQLDITSATVTAVQTLTVDTLYHVAVVKSGTTSCLLYLDGSQLSTTATGAGNDNSFAGNTYYLNLATDRNASSFMSGDLDDFAVFDRALTATEISNLVNGLLPPAASGTTRGFMTPRTKFW